jgi:hypothetical protein
MIQIIKPPKLTKGDTIGVVATSFPFPTDETSKRREQKISTQCSAIPK